MAKLMRLGDLERAVMDHLWSTPEAQTVRQVHEGLSVRRDLAYDGDDRAATIGQKEPGFADPG